MENRALPSIATMTMGIPASPLGISNVHNGPHNSKELPSIFGTAPRIYAGGNGHQNLTSPVSLIPKLAQRESNVTNGSARSNYHCGNDTLSEHEYTFRPPVSCNSSHTVTPDASNRPGYYSPPSSRRHSSDMGRAATNQVQINDHHQQVNYVVQAAPTASHTDHHDAAISDYQFSMRLKETLETASHLYYFAYQTSQNMEPAQKLEALNALHGRLVATTQFVEAWYHKTYSEKSHWNAAPNSTSHQPAVASCNGTSAQWTPPASASTTNFTRPWGNDPDDAHGRRQVSPKSDVGARKPLKKRSRSSGEMIRCHQCGASETPEWRKGPDGARTLCNACGLFHAKLVKKKGEAEAAEIFRGRRDSKIGSPPDLGSSS